MLTCGAHVGGKVAVFHCLTGACDGHKTIICHVSTTWKACWQ